MTHSEADTLDPLPLLCAIHFTGGNFCFSALCIALIQMKVYTNHEAHLAESICKTEIHNTLSYRYASFRLTDLLSIRLLLTLSLLQ